MFSSVLSVLLMGMLPVVSPVPADQHALSALSIASPSPFAANVLTPFSLPKRVTASGVLIVDLQSGQRVYGRNAEQRRPIGSLTKLMTALIIAENHALDEWVTIPAGVAAIEGSRARLEPGEQFTVGDLLTALLVPSANDAAETLARFHSGTSDAFVQIMNERAQVLGLKNTSYANPSGLDDGNQWSTPQDLVWLTSHVLRRPELRARMSTLTETITGLKGQQILLTHTHSLLHTDPAVLAGKTGTTQGAGECVVTLVEEGSREFLVILLSSGERYSDLRWVMQALSSLLG